MSLGGFMRAMALKEFHRRKAKNEKPVMADEFPSLFFRALERRHSEKYAEESANPEFVDLGGEG
jgi:hypothetical protein